MNFALISFKVGPLHIYCLSPVPWSGLLATSGKRRRIYRTQLVFMFIMLETQSKLIDPLQNSSTIYYLP